MKTLLALGCVMAASGALAQSVPDQAPAAPLAGEHLAPPADRSMKLGFAAAAGGQTIREYVRQGESVEDWSRMVTVQSFRVPTGYTADAFLQLWTSKFAQSCAGATIGPIEGVTVSERPAAEAKVVCPLNTRTGKPETVVGRAVMGDSAMLMVQAATRHAFTAEDERWAASLLRGTTICRAASADTRCTATARTDAGAPL